MQAVNETISQTRIPNRNHLLLACQATAFALLMLAGGAGCHGAISSEAAVSGDGAGAGAGQSASGTRTGKPNDGSPTSDDAPETFVQLESVLGPEPSTADPTAPDDTTGVYVKLPPEYDADLAKLVDYKRAPLPPLECPGLLASGGCGDGNCDKATESEETCAADCVFHLAGAYNDLPICTSFMDVREPTTVEEVQSAVRDAVAQGKRIRVLGASHSASQLICGDGVALRMSKFADVSKTEVIDGVAYVQPGVLMIDLGDFLYQQQLSIGYTHLGFRGVTVAGAIGTSAHGSSPKYNSAIAHRVVSLDMVLADGTTKLFTKADVSEDTWRALTTHLGLFGVITRVGVTVEPAFNLDTQIDIMDESELLQADSPLTLLRHCDWGEFNWFPGQKQVLRWCGTSTQAAAEPANNVLLDPGVSPDLAPIAKLGFHAGTCVNDLNALLEEVRFTGLRDAPPILVTEPGAEPRNTSHAIGPAHRMVSADLIKLDTNKYFQMDWEVAIPQQYMADALRAARQVFTAQQVSLPGVGVFLRFAKIERGGWLSYHSAGKQFAEGQTAMFFESPVAVPAGYTDAQLKSYLHVYEQLMALFIRYYGARAHWGKNLDSLFDLERVAGTYAGRVEKMNQVVAELDPYGVFSNGFAERIGIVWPKRGENFAQALGGEACACDVNAEPVCDYKTHTTYANNCRATCKGVTSQQLVPGSCDAYEAVRCSLIAPQTCLYRKLGKNVDPTSTPVIRY